MAALKLSSDSKGFPMLWIEPLQSYINWLPITKIQMERFLCSTTEVEFDDQWYDEILQLNPRESPQALTPANYWRAFVTGIQPSEAEKYARWCGPQYRALTSQEWLQAYDFLKGFPAEHIDWEQFGTSLRHRDLQLLQRLDEIFRSFPENRRTLADQVFLRFGVLEWVRLPQTEQPWGGLGQLDPNFQGILIKPEQGVPLCPNQASLQRFFYFGFRLLTPEP